MMRHSGIKIGQIEVNRAEGNGVIVSFSLPKYFWGLYMSPLPIQNTESALIFMDIYND